MIMKRVLLPALLLTVAMSSCSQNDVDGVDDSVVSSDGNLKINVSAGTTKGEDVTTSSLETSGKVTLHIKDSKNVSSGYDFDNDGGGSDWSQTSSSTLTWDDIELPAYFYSMHDGSAQGVGLADDSATKEYSVSGSSSDHNDLVYHASVLSAIPAGGTINVYHKHALSKIQLYAGTGGNKIYIAKVQFINVDANGKATIQPLSASDVATGMDVTWKNSGTSDETYLYYYVGDEDSGDTEATPQALQSATVDGKTTNPVINDDTASPFMIIPQETTGVTSEQIVADKITGSYLEVIYYLTDSNDAPLVGYSSVSIRTDADNYIDDDQGKTLYVKAAFPVGYDFEANMQYNLTLGVGMTGSTGGLLLEDNYVDRDGNPITLTDKDCGGATTTPEIPEVDKGDEILGDGSDDLNIIVSATNWGTTTEVPLN